MLAPLMAVDGHHLLYRAWWGFSQRRVMSSDGQRDLTGVFGFIALLRKAHLEAAPGHEIIVAFDAEGAAAARQARDPGYKASRAGADHTPVRSLRMVKQCLDTAGIRWAEAAGAEGDDLLATLTAAATAGGRTVTCYSGDKDLYQLLSSDVSILTPARRKVTAAQLPGLHGVTPPQWPDYRALTGDPSDGIPGIRGIGPRTAASLLEGGLHLEHLQDSPRLSRPRFREVYARWDELVTWRDLILLDAQVPLPGGILTGQPTPPLSRAAEILTLASLW
jgi:5'-3' exonuclease